ncbi:MAG: arsenate reductase (glutaredoxin) [Gammaproteobacteria bacterium]|nr:MAG: arsenate reductase (glutaredoxin) [Gammaproteobacteria bacterium]
MVTIYHNPRCSKSRQTLQLLQEQPLLDQQLDIVEYLKTPLNKEQLTQVADQLGCSIRDLVRTSEAEYKENNLSDETLSDEQLLDAMVATPKLMQRPIVVNGDKAAVGRPPESVLDIL